MKNLFTLASALIASSALFAQVTVTFQVDVTPYINDGNTVVAEGIRVGGNFTTNGATTPDWTPADAACAMTDLGDNIWSISIEFPAASAGQELQYKYVNGDWGMNEGAATLEDCGIDDGNGGFNRTMVIPAMDMTECVQWNVCDACPGTGSLESNAIEAVSVYPNPAKDVVNFSASLNGASSASVIVTDLAGRVVANAEITAGAELNLNIADFAEGTYMYSVVAGESVVTGKFTKQ